VKVQSIAVVLLLSLFVAVSAFGQGTSGSKSAADCKTKCDVSSCQTATKCQPGACTPSPDCCPGAKGKAECSSVDKAKCCPDGQPKPCCPGGTVKGTSAKTTSTCAKKATKPM
jgi:hypothetical protein